jgi:predicted TIM-barrel fold metal-dependent hydrolase
MERLEHARWRERNDMPERVKEKILGKNAERFFHL